MLLLLCISGYVNDVKSVLFSARKEKRVEMLNKYLACQPPPLNTQFGEHLPKAEAVERQLQRKSNIAQLYPSGTALAEQRKGSVSPVKQCQFST